MTEASSGAMAVGLRQFVAVACFAYSPDNAELRLLPFLTVSRRLSTSNRLFTRSTIAQLYAGVSRLPPAQA